MSKLIDADRLKNAFCSGCVEYSECNGNTCWIMELIDYAPAVIVHNPCPWELGEEFDS